MTLTETLAEIAATWEASGSGCTLPLYYEQSPQNTTGDYAVYFIVTDAPEYTFTTRNDLLLIQFTVFTDERDDPTNAILHTEALRALYDNRTMYTLEVTNLISMTRQPGTRPIPDPDGGYMYPTRYLVELKHGSAAALPITRYGRSRYS